MSNSNSIHVAPERRSSLPHSAFWQSTQHAYAVKTPEKGEEVELMCKQNRDFLGGLPDDVWRIILKKCCQDGVSSLYSISWANKACKELVEEVRNWQRRQFLFSTEAEALLEKESLKELQHAFQILSGAVEDEQMHAFLFSKEQKTLLTEQPLKELQNTFQCMREAAKQGEALQAMLHQQAFHQILLKEFPNIVRAASLKQKNPPLMQLIQSFLLNKLKRGNFFEAIKLLSTRSIPTYENRYPDMYELNLTLGNLVAMELGTLEEFGGGASLDRRVNDELGLFMLTRISSFFNQEQKPDMKRFIGLMPSWVWGGVVQTYKNYSVIGAKSLLASKVDAIAGAEAAHWAISNGKKDLLIALLENNFNPNALSHSGKSELCCAIEADRPDMVDALLKSGADVSHLLRLDSSINPIHWAIARNRENFLSILLALKVDQNVLDQALAYAKKTPHVRASTIKILLEH